jgi:hypothetical protein
MSNSVPQTLNASREAALGRIERIERSLEQLAVSVRSETAALQVVLGQIRLNLIEMHSHAVSGPTPLTEPPVGGDAPGGSAEGALLVALDLIGSDVGLQEANERLSEAFPGIDADRVLRHVGAASGQ